MRICPRCANHTEATVCPDDGATTIPVNNAAATYAPGTVIADRYRLDAVIGIGGFGAVYRGVQLAMDQVVAVKVLKSEHIQSEEHVKRFAREAKAASKLRHANTIRLFDFGSHTDHALYLAMEFLEGQTLAALLDAEDRLPAARVIHIMTQICHSLTEAHEQGIIHRDLKPENIMLLPMAGKPDFVKVLDFGIAAKVAESGEGDEKLTEIGMIMGTPAYMSPEQALGKPLDARSDIYALGVLMYEGLCGTVPFEGDQPMNVLVRHINDPPVPPSKRVPGLTVPPALERLVLRCLEKESRLRPQSTAALAIELEKTLASPEGALRRGVADGAALDHDAVARTAAVAGLTEAPQDGGQTGAIASVGPQRRPSAVASPTAPAGRSPLWLGAAAAVLVAAMVSLVVVLTPSAPLDGAAAQPEPSPQGSAPAAAGPMAAPTPDPGAPPSVAAEPANAPNSAGGGSLPMAAQESSATLAARQAQAAAEARARTAEAKLAADAKAAADARLAAEARAAADARLAAETKDAAEARLAADAKHAAEARAAADAKAAADARAAAARAGEGQAPGGGADASVRPAPDKPLKRDDFRLD